LTDGEFFKLAVTKWNTNVLTNTDLLGRLREGIGDKNMDRVLAAFISRNLTSYDLRNMELKLQEVNLKMQNMMLEMQNMMLEMEVQNMLREYHIFLMQPS
jgi:hypothetical protein